MFKKMSTSGYDEYPFIYVFICRKCATCIGCDRVCINRPVEHLLLGSNIMNKNIDDKQVKVCYSLPYMCLKCHPCQICKKGIRFPGEKFHDKCLFIMMCRGTFDMQNYGQITIFSVFPKDLLKYLLSFFLNCTM